MEFIKQPNAACEYGGRVLISKETYEEIQREAISNHCRACYAEHIFTHIDDGAVDCSVCGATDDDE